MRPIISNPLPPGPRPQASPRVDPALARVDVETGEVGGGRDVKVRRELN